MCGPYSQSWASDTYTAYVIHLMSYPAAHPLQKFGSNLCMMSHPPAQPCRGLICPDLMNGLPPAGPSSLPLRRCRCLVPLPIREDSLQYQHDCVPCGVSPNLLNGLPPAGPAAYLCEDILRPPEVEVARSAMAGAAAPCLEALLPVLVIDLALLRIRQHLMDRCGKGGSQSVN